MIVHSAVDAVAREPHVREYYTNRGGNTSRREIRAKRGGEIHIRGLLFDPLADDPIEPCSLLVYISVETFITRALDPPRFSVRRRERRRHSNLHT